MDSTENLNGSASSTNDEKIGKERLLNVLPSKRSRFLATSRRQNFCFPSATIMLYIAKHPPSAKLYDIMIKTCKFFFIKNPILVFSDAVFQLAQLREANGAVRIDSTKVISKTWFLKSLTFYGQTLKNLNILSSIVPKIFRCDAKELTLSTQNMDVSDFNFLVTKVEQVFLYNVTVTGENNGIVPVQKLFEAALHVKEFKCTSNAILSNITTKTFAELLKLPHFLELEYLCFDHIPEVFDLETFYTHMKKNTHTNYNLHFDETFSGAYKKRIEDIIDEIVASEEHDYKTPLINFTGLDSQKYNALFDKYY